jgi:hypothetical protein
VGATLIGLDSDVLEPEIIDPGGRLAVHRGLHKGSVRGVAPAPPLFTSPRLLRLALWLRLGRGGQAVGRD